MCLKSVLVSHFLCLRKKKKKFHSRIYHSGDINEKCALHFIHFRLIPSIQFKSHLFKAIHKTQALGHPGSEWEGPLLSVQVDSKGAVPDRQRWHRAAVFDLLGWHLLCQGRRCSFSAGGWGKPRKRRIMAVRWER